MPIKNQHSNFIAYKVFRKAMNNIQFVAASQKDILMLIQNQLQ